MLTILFFSQGCRTVLGVGIVTPMLPARKLGLVEVKTECKELVQNSGLFLFPTRAALSPADLTSK